MSIVIGKYFIRLADSRCDCRPFFRFSLIAIELKFDGKGMICDAGITKQQRYRVRLL